MRNNKLAEEHQKTKRDQLNVALYIRLSREDGDKTESFSIGNQRLLLTKFINEQEDLLLYETYIDDGYTGTNFVEVR